MSFIVWIIMGLIVGAITGFLMKSSYPWYIDLLLGIVGSAVGGWLSTVFLGVDLSGGFNLTSLVTAVVGAVIVVAIVRLVFRGRSSL
ncbi:GlsB/YeaQ/YmgE family stress response membrane protein [Candidatus Chloroploca sp. Khr17]|uniref:GlsB/YeaQ/YmgE family stress response membrane protein n=1 Tax=Candidatus Chloroploca sp. Khr17 TaxID=2496869 RepID=UPI00101BFF39|nr:GlsB/YeaQ/YmgE family stress response membrane protein [Candidatus Chloroploca sp. Khr17]